MMPTRNHATRRNAFPSFWRALGLSGIALAWACACAGPKEVEPAGDEPGASKLSVRGAQATAAGGMGAIYFTIDNPGSEDDRLIRVETPAAQGAETHETVDEDGVLRMMPRPEGFQVPAGGSLELQPGGKHIMLIDPRAPEGAPPTIIVTLHFEQAGAIEVEVPFLSFTEGGDSGHEGHEMEHGEHGMEHGDGQMKSHDSEGHDAAGKSE